MLMKPIEDPRTTNRNAVLDEAVRLLNKNGHCLGRAKAWWGGLCAISAIRTADLNVSFGGDQDRWLEKENYSDAYNDAVYSLHKLPQLEGQSIPDWNDNLPFFGSKKRVIAVLEDAKTIPLL